MDFLIWPTGLPMSLVSAPLGVPLACSLALEGPPGSVHHWFPHVGSSLEFHLRDVHNLPGES